MPVRSGEHIAFSECLHNTYPDSVFIDTKAKVYYDSASYNAADFQPHAPPPPSLAVGPTYGKA